MAQGWRHYRYARLVDFHDGDTCSVQVDHGFAMYHQVEVRLFGLSCPELTGAEKPLGQDALRIARTIAWQGAHDAEVAATDGIPCELWTWRSSFSRYVGRVVLAGGTDIARAVIESGYGHAWDGKTERRPFDPSRFPMPAPAIEEAALYDWLLRRDFNL